MPSWLRGGICLLALYLFISSVAMIGTGLKTIAEDDVGDRFLDQLFGLVDDPVTGLFIGLLITALVQSSSFTISMIVGLVADGDITLSASIPIIMGANIGTSITGLLVSMGHLRQRNEFRRSLSAACCHDFFNLLSVLVFLPLELKFRIISRPVTAIAGRLAAMGYAGDPTQKIGLFKKCVKGFGKLFDGILENLHVDAIPRGAIVAILAMVLLFVALWLLVKMLRGLVQGRLSTVFNKTLFRNPATAFVVGIVMTTTVQSSSVTISMIVPLVGAGVLRLSQVFPYMLGANIGTTVTALLASFGKDNAAAAIACGCAHLIFNIYGTLLFWPLQALPITMAKTFGQLASRRKPLAVGFVLGLFFLLPALVLLIMKWAGQLR